jgi:hypothetical protein
MTESASETDRRPRLARVLAETHSTTSKCTPVRLTPRFWRFMTADNDPPELPQFDALINIFADCLENTNKHVWDYLTYYLELAHAPWTVIQTRCPLRQIHTARAPPSHESGFVV